MAQKNPPPGYHTVTPYLVVDDTAAAIDFYRRAFGAEEVYRFEHEGKIGHAEIQIGSSRIMLSDEWPDWGYRSAKSIGATPVSLMVYVDDVDTVHARAVEAGATERSPVQDQFYGDRSGNLTDPFGHQWTIGTHKEDVPLDEMQRRFRDMMKEMAGA
ncbi:MAG: VOC family protein [Gemmatimonadota bacterium]|nr:VOC family protein [Gemmatimonadota bacterium]